MLDHEPHGETLAPPALDLGGQGLELAAEPAVFSAELVRELFT